jgi:hypothetical protein
MQLASAGMDVGDDKPSNSFVVQHVDVMGVTMIDSALLVVRYTAGRSWHAHPYPQASTGAVR